MRRTLFLALVPLLLSACTSTGGGRSTDDPRVRSFRGQVPPELAQDVQWSNSAPTSLAGLRGRVVYVQFAFPT